MSRKALQAINWTALAERISESERAAFTTFKSVSDKYLQRMMANPAELPQIDWSYYKKTVVTPGLVDKFQKEYEGLSIPYPADTYTDKIDVDKNEMAKKIEAFIQETNAAIEKTQKDLDKIKNMIPFAEMTMEDYAEINPEGCFGGDKPTTWPHTKETQDSEDDIDD
ncbi:ATP synthase subunit d, mitochondrial, partial [Eufriesea mexicana]